MRITEGTFHFINSREGYSSDYSGKSDYSKRTPPTRRLEDLYPQGIDAQVRKMIDESYQRGKYLDYSNPNRQKHHLN